MKIGCLQFSPAVGDVNNNLSRADAVLLKANVEELDLLVLPEMAFSGYNFKSLAEISPFLEPSGSGISSLWARTTALRYNAHVVVGYPEKVDAARKWPTSPEYYNSVIVVNPEGETVVNYRKTHLYATDERWALEGKGFYRGFVPCLGQVSLGVCMDINPYRFESAWDAFEFGFHVLHSESNLVVLSMAWVSNKERSRYTSMPYEPDLEVLAYWAQRLEPVIRAEGEDEVIVVICNRCGTETGSDGEEVTYSGTSVVLGIKQGEVSVYGLLGRGEKELLVVDTNSAPFAKMVLCTSSGDDASSVTSIATSHLRTDPGSLRVPSPFCTTKSRRTNSGSVRSGMEETKAKPQPPKLQIPATREKRNWKKDKDSGRYEDEASPHRRPGRRQTQSADPETIDSQPESYFRDHPSYSNRVNRVPDSGIDVDCLPLFPESGTRSRPVQTVSPLPKNTGERSHRRTRSRTMEQKSRSKSRARARSATTPRKEREDQVSSEVNREEARIRKFKDSPCTTEPDKTILEAFLNALAVSHHMPGSSLGSNTNSMITIAASPSVLQSFSINDATTWTDTLDSQMSALLSGQLDESTCTETYTEDEASKPKDDVEEKPAEREGNLEEEIIESQEPGGKQEIEGQAEEVPGGEREASSGRILLPELDVSKRPSLCGSNRSNSSSVPPPTPGMIASVSALTPGLKEFDTHDMQEWHKLHSTFQAVPRVRISEASTPSDGRVPGEGRLLDRDSLVFQSSPSSSHVPFRLDLESAPHQVEVSPSA